jgi:hypothetical protein
LASERKNPEFRAGTCRMNTKRGEVRRNGDERCELWEATRMDHRYGIWIKPWPVFPVSPVCDNRKPIFS